MLSSILVPMKLKNAARWEYRVRLVCCFLPSVILFRKVRMSSEEISSRSLSPKVKSNFVRIDSYDLVVFGLPYSWCAGKTGGKW